MPFRAGFVALSVIIAGGAAAGLFHKPILRAIVGSQSGPPGEQVRGDDSIRFEFGEITDEWNAPDPWRSRVITGGIDVRPEPSEELDQVVLRVRSDRAHYIIWDQTRTFDPAEYPILTWSWSAEELPVGGDVRTHDKFYFSTANKNDKGLQVLVGFEGEKVLMYAWDSTAPVGTEVMESSPVATIATRIVDSGNPAPGRWRHHEIDIYQDFIRRFGETPGLVLGISIQTNSNHTSSSSEGLVSPIVAKRGGIQGP